LSFTIEDFFRKWELEPAVDSDGGGDYVDNVDDLQAAKFNLRWNGIHELYKDLQTLLKVQSAGITASRLIGQFYPPESGNVLVDSDLPFEYEISAIDRTLIILGDASTILLDKPGNLQLPNSLLVDLIDADDLKFSIATGSTNLFEVQDDYPTTPATWYRLGHDGAEGTPETVVVEHDLGAQYDDVTIDVVFEDHLNAPSTKSHIVGVKDSVGGSVYVELLSTGGQTNYLLNIVADDGGGGTNSYLLVDTGVARSAADHTLQVIGYPDGRIHIYLDGSLVWSSSVVSTDWLNGIDTLYFSSTNDNGSQDYFDIKRFDCHQCKGFQFSNSTTNYIYIDISDSGVKTTTTRATALVNHLLLVVVVPAATTTLTEAMIYDFRDLSAFADNALIDTATIDTATIDSLAVSSSVTTDLPVDGKITSSGSGPSDKSAIGDGSEDVELWSEGDGIFQASYNFDGETVMSGAGWSIIAPHSDTPVTASKHGHGYVPQVQAGYGNSRTMAALSGAQILEFYFLLETDDTSDTSTLIQVDNGSTTEFLEFNVQNQGTRNQLIEEASGSTVVIDDLESDRWYHIKVLANFTTGDFSIYIDGILAFDDLSFTPGSATRVRVGGDTAAAHTFVTYIDAIDMSWESGVEDQTLTGGAVVDAATILSEFNAVISGMGVARDLTALEKLGIPIYETASATKPYVPAGLYAWHRTDTDEWFLVFSVNGEQVAVQLLTNGYLHGWERPVQQVFGGSGAIESASEAGACIGLDLEETDDYVKATFQVRQGGTYRLVCRCSVSAVPTGNSVATDVDIGKMGDGDTIDGDNELSNYTTAWLTGLSSTTTLYFKELPQDLTFATGQQVVVNIQKTADEGAASTYLLIYALILVRQ